MPATAATTTRNSTTQRRASDKRKRASIMAGSLVPVLGGALAQLRLHDEAVCGRVLFTRGESVDHLHPLRIGATGSYHTRPKAFLITDKDDRVVFFCL